MVGSTRGIARFGRTTTLNSIAGRECRQTRNHAAAGGGEVLVTASVENGSLRIEVSDTGPGFDLRAIRADHGLDNLVRRLDSLFGPSAHLNVFQRHGRCVVEMVLPRS